jgi:hypothetical protein
MELTETSWSYLLWEWKQWSSVLNVVVNYLLKYVTEGKIEGIIEVTGRWGRRSKQLLDGFKEKTGYWKLIRGLTISSSVENSLWKAYGLIVRHTTKRVIEKSVSTDLSKISVYTNKIRIENSTACPPHVLVCFLWLSEQSVGFSLYDFNWLIF